MTFRRRLEKNTRWLQSLPQVHVIEAHIGDPLTEEELENAHARLGFELDARFVDYFRQCNGWSLRWVYAQEEPSDLEAEFDRAIEDAEHWRYGRFAMPGLYELLLDGRGIDTSAVLEDRPLEFLGGTTEATLRQNSYAVGALGNLPRSVQGMPSYNDLFVFTCEQMPDPVCYVTTDYCADLTNFRPMRARTFFELGLAFLGSSELLDWFEVKGYGGDHELVEVDTGALPDLFFFEQDTLMERVEYSREYLQALGAQAGLKRYAGVSTALPAPPPAFFVYMETFEGPSGGPTTGEVLARVRDLAIFEEEQEDGLMGLQLLLGRRGEGLEDCDAYLRVSLYNPERQPEGAKLDELQLHYQEGFPEGDRQRLRDALAALELIPDDVKESPLDDADHVESFGYVPSVRIEDALEVVRDLDMFTYEDRPPHPRWNGYQNVRLHTHAEGDTRDEPRAWLIAGPLGSYLPEGCEVLEAAELFYGDDFPQDSLTRLRALFAELGLTPHWRNRARP